MKIIPSGKGYFIWNISQTEGGDIAAIVSSCQQAGVSWVAIKTSDGIADFGDTAKIQALVIALHAADILVFAWQYTYVFFDPAREARKAAERTKMFGMDGFITDPEWEARDKATRTQAITYCTALRAELGDLSIGMCSYRYPSMHMGIDWDVFLKVSDYHCPQVYWLGAHNPGAQLRESHRQLMALKPLPFVPAGAAFPDGAWYPAAADLDDFSNTAKDLDCPGLIWWSWEHARKYDFWNTIAKQDWGALPSPEEDMLSELRQLAVEGEAAAGIAKNKHRAIIDKIDGAAPPVEKMQVKAGVSLNTRTGPGLNYSIIQGAGLSGGTVITILERVTNPDTSIWVHQDAGWNCQRGAGGAVYLDPFPA